MRRGYDVPGMFLLHHTCILTAYCDGSPSKYCLEQLCTQPNDVATVGNIFRTAVVE